jgi:hypothetical protein
MDASTGVISVGLPCKDALPRVRRAMEDAGFRAVVTFDLQLARSSGAACSCPHHGAAPCDCQLVVLMIYGEDSLPGSLMLHGTDGRTWITFPEGALGIEPGTKKAVQASVGHLLVAEGL